MLKTGSCSTSRRGSSLPSTSSPAGAKSGMAATILGTSPRTWDGHDGKATCDETIALETSWRSVSGRLVHRLVVLRSHRGDSRREPFPDAAIARRPVGRVAELSIGNPFR